MDYPLEGKIGVVAGWGKTDNSFGKTGTNLLNKVCFIKFQRFRIYPASMKLSCEIPAQSRGETLRLHAGNEFSATERMRFDVCGPCVV